MTDLTINQVYAIGAPIVLAMILIEVFFSSIYNKNLYKKDDTLCTIGLLTGNILMVFALKGITLALHFYLFQFKLFNLSALMPVWALWILTFVMIDLVFYFYHRISHRVNFLWAIHMSHHSSEEMNFAVSFRQAWFGPISKLPFFMVLPLIGFDPTIIAVAGVVSTLWGIVGHTQIVGKLGPLEWIFNTPSHHRVHHGANRQYIDKNYGNLLIIWDRMFGTYTPQKPELDPVYGTATPLNSWNPVWANFQVFSIMIKDTIKTKSWKDKFRVWFSETYWRPEDCIEEKNPKDFYKKFNPKITYDIKIFSFIQMLFTIAVSGSVLTFVTAHQYSEIATFGILIIVISMLTSYLMQSKTVAYRLLMFFSFFSIFGIYYFEMLSLELLSTKLILAQFYLNILAVITIYGTQSLQNINLLRTKTK